MRSAGSGGVRSGASAESDAQRLKAARYCHSFTPSASPRSVLFVKSVLRYLRGMTDDGKKTGKDARERRLAEQLRANLQRRKAQVRARRAGDADETEGLPAARPSDEEEDRG